MFGEGSQGRSDGEIEERREQLVRVIENEPFTARAGSFVAAMAVAILWDDLPHWALFSWWAGVAALSLARLAYADHLRKQVCKLASPVRALRLLTIGAFIAGCLWAVAPLLHPGLHASHGFLLVVVIAGLTAGSAIRGGIFAPQPIAFVSPMLVVTAGKLMLVGELETNAVAFTIIFYHWFLVRATQRQERISIQASRLKNEAVRNFESIRLYETAMQNAPFGMFIATPEARIIRGNPALCAMLGCAPEELCTEGGLTKFVHADDVAAVRESYRRLAAGESDKERLEARYVKASGKPFWIYSERTLLRDAETGAPKYVIGQVQGIEARKQAERELERTVRQKNVAVEAAGLGEFVFRYRPNAPGKGVEDLGTVWNDRLYEIFGVTRENYDCSQEALQAAIHPDDLERVIRENSDEFLRGKAQYSVSYRIVRPSGEFRHVKSDIASYRDEEQNCMVRVGVVADVTDQVTFTRKLSEALTRSELAAAIAGVGVSQFDPEQQRWVRDENLARIYGYDHSALPVSLEFWLDEIVHPDDRQTVMDALLAVRAPGETTRASLSYRIVRPSGEVRHVKTENVVTYASSGEIASALSATLDVTQYVELAEALEAQKLELQQSLEQRRLAIDVAGLGEYRRDLRAGKAEWSERLYEIFGVTPDTCDCSGKFLQGAMHPEDRDRIGEKLKGDIAAFREDEELKERTGEISYRILRPSGEIRYLTSHAYFHRFGDEPDAIAVLGLIEDKTDEVRLRQALEKEKADLESALTRAQLATELAGLGVYELDAQENKSEWDERLCEIFGLDPAVGGSETKSWLSMAHPDDRKSIVDALKRSAAERRPFQMEYRIIRPTGEIRHLKVASATTYDDAGSLMKAVVVTWDVTDQTRLLERAEGERSLLDATLTAIGDAVVRTDEKGRIEYMNRAACEMASLKKNDEVFGARLLSRFNLIGADGKTVVSCTDQKSGAGRSCGEGACAVRNVPVRLVFDDGAVREIELSVEQLHKTTGECSGQVVVLHDVTELRKSEAALAESRNLFHIALDHAPVGLSVIDSEGCFSFVNKALTEITGYSEKGMIGKPASELFSRNDALASNIVDFESARKQDAGEIVFEKMVKRLGGDRVRARIDVKRVHDDKDKVIYSVAQIQDITAEIRRMEELHEAKELAQVTISSANEGIVRVDEDGVMTLCNPVAAAFVGAEPVALVGQAFADTFKFKIGARKTTIEDPVALALKRGEPVRMNSMLKLQGEHGVLHRVNISVAPLIGGNKAVTGAVALIQDASEIAQLTERLTEQAYTDELTGLGNRRAFEERLHECVRTPRHRRGRDFLLFIDLDHFKIVNDVCGHGVGDQLLGDLSRIFVSQVRDSDFVGRLGGDEFGIIMHGADEASVTRTAQKTIDEVSAYRLNHNNETFQVGASIGIAEIGEGADASSLMIEADTACNTAKNMGRGRYYLYHANDAAIAETRKSQSWFNRILHGMEDGQFRLYLQQIVSREKKPVGFEALLRFSEGDKTFGPGAFMDTARRHNLLPKFDRFMFESVVRLLDGEAGASPALEGKYISVNLSASSVADPVFRDWIEEMLDKYERLTRRLWLELTESDRMKWTDSETAFLRAVRARGVRLYFDDFGTGYNSFDVLKRVEVDGLKLDHSVIRNIVASPIDQALVLASLSIAQNIDLDVVAEGVEDKNTFDFLSSIGVKKFQGYLFHKPEEASKLLQASKAKQKKAG